MNIPFANIWEFEGDTRALWRAFQAQHLPRLRVIQSGSMHSCNGAYLCATDEPIGETVSEWEFRDRVQGLQKTYMKAFAMSRGA
jgi:hypothetical protein